MQKGKVFRILPFSDILHTFTFAEACLYALAGAH